jgi:hypothetical protein
VLLWVGYVSRNSTHYKRLGDRGLRLAPVISKAQRGKGAVCRGPRAGVGGKGGSKKGRCTRSQAGGPPRGNGYNSREHHAASHCNSFLARVRLEHRQHCWHCARSHASSLSKIASRNIAERPAAILCHRCHASMRLERRHNCWRCASRDTSGLARVGDCHKDERPAAPHCHSCHAAGVVESVSEGFALALAAEVVEGVAEG